MSKYIVTVSVTLSNTFEIETEEYDGEPVRIREMHLMQDAEDDIVFPRRVNILEDITLRGKFPTGERWEIDDIEVDDVSFMNPTKLKFTPSH